MDFSQPRGKFSFLPSAAGFFIGISLLIATAAAVGFLVITELRAMKAPADDAGWTIFQLGFEHQRLLLAVEKGEGLDEIRLRGDIYLSRVFLVRDAPMLADVRQSMMKDSLAGLFISAQATERLLSQVNLAGGRSALLTQLRGDARMIRELMLDMSNIDRKIDGERRVAHTQSLLFYLTILEVLLLALVALCFFVLRISRKLRRAGREVVAQLARQNAILRAVDSGIIGLGPQGTVHYSNPRAFSLLGPCAGNGAALSEAAGEEGSLVREIQSLLAEPAEPGNDGLAGLRRVHVAGEGGMRHFVLRRFSTAREASEDASDIITIADVTAEEEAAHRRDEYDARIAEASRLLAFAAISGGIVHEISQPLAAIRNYIYALKVSLNLRQGSEEHVTIADRLGDEIDRAIDVVRNVRRMGPQNLQDSEDVGVCEVNEVIANSVRLVTLGQTPPPPIKISSQEPEALLAGSLPLIGQVVVNLLKNALSASAAAGHAGAEVNVSLRQDCAEIAVADYGTGVSADAAKTLFAPFSKSARGGMGLGLAICQRIAATLGGSLSWENRDNAGAIFRFTVPLAKEGNMP